MRTLKDGGFARQVENFKILISLATQLGANYNPAKENLKLTNMQTLQTNAAQAVDDWIDAFNTLERLTSLRKEELKKLNQLATQISREVKACGIRGEILSDINGAIRQLRGRKVSSGNNNSAPGTQVNPEPNSTTTEKRGGVNYTFERKFDAFHRLVEVLEKTTEYESNDLELKIVGLKDKSDFLKTLQNDYTNAIINLQKQRGIRDKWISSDLVSIAYVGKLAKEYLRNQYKGSLRELSTLAAIRLSPITV